MDSVSNQSSRIRVKSPSSLKNRQVNIEIRDGAWYLLPGTLLCPPVPTFQEHTRRKQILQNYGEELENDWIKIIKEYPVTGELSAWHLVQGNHDGTPRFEYKSVQREIKEEKPKINYDLTDKEVAVTDRNDESDELDDLVERLKKKLYVTRCPPHLMRPHPTLPILYCEYGCRFKIDL